MKMNNLIFVQEHLPRIQSVYCVLFYLIPKNFVYYIKYINKNTNTPKADEPHFHCIITIIILNQYWSSWHLIILKQPKFSQCLPLEAYPPHNNISIVIEQMKPRTHTRDYNKSLPIQNSVEFLKSNHTKVHHDDMRMWINDYSSFI